MKKESRFNRRRFMENLGALGIGGAAIPVTQLCLGADKQQEKENEQAARNTPQSPPEALTIPKRPLGKTGIKVPVLAVGLSGVDRFFPEAYLKYGVSYWDTSIRYGGGKMETALGEYFNQNPGVRDKIFMVTKSDDVFRHNSKQEQINVERIDSEFNDSYQKLGGNPLGGYIALHAVDVPNHISPEVGDWISKKKAEGKFRVVGISTHSKMAQVLLKAAKTDWVDFVYTRYNFSLFNDEEMQDALDACHQAGKGIVAIKTQRNLGVNPEVLLNGPYETDALEAMVQKLKAEGYTDGQAKLKMVLDDKRFSAAAVSMSDIGILTQNVAAAMDQTKLSQASIDALQIYADATAHLSCQGCSGFCERAIPEMPYVADVIRSLVYHHGHGDHALAQQNFEKLPDTLRRNLKHFNYARAEAACPHHLAISRMMHEAHDLFA